MEPWKIKSPNAKYYYNIMQELRFYDDDDGMMTMMVG